MYECFKTLIDEKETTLLLDEYSNMLLIKNYYSASMLLFLVKDTFQKGLNDIDIEDKAMFVNEQIPKNKICI